MKTMMKGPLHLATAALLMSAWLAACDSERYRAEEKFGKVQKQLKASIDELTRIPAKTELSAQPYVKGKIAVFTRTKDVAGGAYSTDIFYFRELNEIYAATPEEVGTVALLDCKTTQKGTYKTKDGKEYPAKVEDCELTMIDRAKATVVFRKMFEKTPSESYKVSGDSILRQTSHLDIAPFLKGLPRN